MKNRTKNKASASRFRNFFTRKKGIILICFILVLVIFRLFLPTIVKNYINKTLNNIPGYHGHVEDVDIALYRGAYVINRLYLFKDGDKKPMLYFSKSDISIEWKSLFKGRIVSEIEMYRPKVTLYVTGNKLSAKEKPKHNDWTSVLKKLVPIKINRLTVTEGELAYADIIESPDIDLSIKQVSLVVTNMGNVVDRQKALPSKLTMKGVSFGKGNLSVDGNLNFLKRIPDLDLNLALKKSDVTALNDVSMAAAGFDFERGQFELYIEAAIKNGYLNGYVKPMFHNIKIPDSFKKKSPVLKRVWEGIITFFGFVLKNKSKDSFATKVPVEGDLNDPKTDTWVLIKNIFRNGFVEPFKNEVDNDIRFNDSKPAGKEKKK